MSQSIRSVFSAVLLCSCTIAWAANPADVAPPAPVVIKPKAADAREVEKDFGPSGFFSSYVDGFALKPFNDAALYEHGSASGAYYCRAPSAETRAVGQFVLPHGVRISSTRVWGFDGENTRETTAVYQQSCLPDFAAGQPAVSTFGSVASGIAFNGGAWSDFDNPATQTIADTQSCTYRVLITVSSGGNCLADINMGVYKARINWARFIPPAPAAATFGDVPASHPFFAHIEALVESGITAGCGTGANYCPNEPVTRAQMAAFLARALGLPPAVIADPANP